MNIRYVKLAPREQAWLLMAFTILGPLGLFPLGIKSFDDLAEDLESTYARVSDGRPFARVGDPFAIRAVGLLRGSIGGTGDESLDEMIREDLTNLEVKLWSGSPWDEFDLEDPERTTATDRAREAQANGEFGPTLF